MIRVMQRVKWLAAASSDAWLEQALADPDTLLLDHAHCERKAAGAALQLMFRYPSDGGLARVLSPLAREELEHFERVQALLERRGVPLRPLQAPAYGSELGGQVRRREPDRLLDSLLVAGLIEARSHERMALLAAQSCATSGPSCWPARPATSVPTGYWPRSASAGRPRWSGWRRWLRPRLGRCAANLPAPSRSACILWGWPEDRDQQPASAPTGRPAQWASFRSRFRFLHAGKVCRQGLIGVSGQEISAGVNKAAIQGLGALLVTTCRFADAAQTGAFGIPRRG